MKILIILNDPPYGTERSYNGLRLAKGILRSAPESELIVFLMADAVGCAKRGQTVPSGYYNLELMIQSVVRAGRVLLCGTCMDARSLSDGEIVEGAQRSTLGELADIILEAERVLVF